MTQKFHLAGVMGWPISHSRSPTIHNHWLKKYALNGVYVPLPVDPSQPKQLENALRGLAALGFAGCNLTIPHKVMALPFMDSLADNAKIIGAVNTVVVKANGHLHGMNTDGFGFMQSLEDAVPNWLQLQRQTHSLVVGSGGAARAIVVALRQANIHVTVCNRTDATADALASELDAQFLPWAQRHSALDGLGLLVNTTNQGMTGQAALDLDLQALPQTALVSDVVYTPQHTPLLQNAQQRGNPIATGLPMLLHQARPAFAAWFGVTPEVTADLWRELAV